MSFMAVAYVPAFLEDRATFIKERANGLYGSTAFIISNFIIGLPFLCKTRIETPLTKQPTNPAKNKSHNLHPLLRRRLLALQFPTHSLGIFHLGNVALPRPSCRRIPRRPRLLDLPELRHLSCTGGVFEWVVDVCRWVYGFTDDSESVLEICFSLY